MIDVVVDGTDRTSGHWIIGQLSLRRIRRFGFPAYELLADGKSVAQLGRAGWLGVFFGRGQRIELADGAVWRLKSIGDGGMICPAVLDERGRRVAVSSVGVGGYGINGRDYGCLLFHAEKPRFGRANRWILREHDDECASVLRYPAMMEASLPVHIGAVVMSFALIRFGILGERAPRLRFRW